MKHKLKLKLKLKLKILHYSILSRVSYLAIEKNEFVTDIACSNKIAALFSGRYFLGKGWRNIFEVQAQDLALYTHWPVHTKEFWDLLNET
jgi:DNA-binding XRE family transcriptional regulator